jgi:GntR family transcriptional regulator, transcriptional repressor for pyruvate dehydrogenase complex
MARPTSLPRAAPASREKRGDRVVSEIKRWLVSNRLKPGERLPKESDLQELFAISKGTAREALKSLEVQGLVTLRAGRSGGATVSEVPFARTVQLLQNYFFFKEVDIGSIYALRRLLEPELLAGAIPHLSEAALRQLEHSVESCEPVPASRQAALAQRQEDLHFHDLIAAANPNPLLRFMCRLLTQMLQRMVSFDAARVLDRDYLAFGKANSGAHRRIIEAIRARDVENARRLMLQHIVYAERHVRRLQGRFRRQLLLDADMQGPSRPVADLRREPLRQQRG